MTTDEQRAAIERLRRAADQLSENPIPRDGGWLVTRDQMCALIEALQVLAEHPADDPSVADELREARRLLKQCREWLMYADRCVVNAFLDRTSRFEEPTGA